MKDKLQHLINSEENLTNSGFAKMLGIQPATISHLLAGRNKPSYELLQKILMRFPNVSSDWLMLDRGDMLRDPSLTPSGMPRMGNVPMFGSESCPPVAADGPNHVATSDTMSNPAASVDGVRQGTIFDAASAAEPVGGRQAVRAVSPETQTLRESNIFDAAELAAVSSQSRAGVQVERVVVFYADKTFDTYIPKK